MAALDYAELRFQARTIRQLISGNGETPYHLESHGFSEEARRSMRLKAVERNFTRWEVRWQSKLVSSIVMCKVCPRNMLMLAQSLCDVIIKV